MGLFDRLKGSKEQSPQERRNHSIEKMKKMKVVYNEHLPLLPSNDQVKLKNAKEVKTRAMACILAIQLACSIRNGEDYVDAVSFVLDMMNQWKLTPDDFLPSEKVLFTNQFTAQDVTNVIWTYEVYWVLLWALDLITDKEVMKVNKICNTERAIAIAGMMVDLDLKLKSVDKILDMLDLMYCYHWACVEKRIKPETEIGDVKSEVVVERRKALEWLMSEEIDWNMISLDT